MMSVNAEFDLFAPKYLQGAILDTIETTYNPIATIDQSYLEITIPAHSDFYIDPNIYICVRLIVGFRRHSLGQK
jgi:hypothetical protein